MKPLTEATAKLLAPLNIHPDDRMRVEIDETLTKFTLTLWAPCAYSPGSNSAPHHQAKAFIQRMPEQKWLEAPGGVWQVEVGATDTTCELIRALWPTNQLVFSADAKQVYDYLLITADARELVATNYANYRAAKLVPDHDVPMREDKPLTAHQQVALVNSMMSEGYGSFMEQGAGKTAPTITEICEQGRRMKEGTFDVVGMLRSQAMINAELEAEIAKRTAESKEKVADAVQRKQDRLEASAKRQAERMQVEFSYSGGATGLMAAAQRRVQEAESWLRRRLYDIRQFEVPTLASAYREAAEASLARDINLLRAQAAGRIAALQPEFKPGEGRPYRCIIVCPKGVRSNWLSEFEGFATQCGNVQIIRGGPIRRMKQLIEAFMIDDDTKFVCVVVGYETLVKSWEALGMIQWDLAVTDEGHYYKNPNTTRFEYVMKLRDISAKRLTLTGTPITNTELDLYAQFEFMGKGFSGFTSWQGWKDFYAVYEDTQNGKKIVGTQKANIPFLQERLARLSFQVTKAEALPGLPDKVYDVIEVEMSEQQEDIYRQVAEQLAAEIEDELDSSNNKSLTINCILTKLLRLAQITSGFVSWDAVYDPHSGEELRGGRLEFFNPDVKLEQLVETLKEKGPNDKTIVWSCWVPNIRRIKERLDLEGIRCVTYYGSNSEDEREAAVRDFNCDRGCKVFIGNPAAGGTGLNLLGYPPHDGAAYETNANHVIYYSQNWSPTARWQSEDRAHRRGTREPVRYSDLVVPQTIDEQIRARVLKKKENALTVADIRSVLRAVLEGVTINE